MAVVLWRNSRIVLLDEPDAHLHTSLQRSMVAFFRDLAEKFNLQIIMATHSRDIIGHAPIESIIPIDPYAKHIKPISSVDHLLSEFRRLGTISNPDIALLYQSKRCLFVEGLSEVQWLPEIASRLGITAFQGMNQIVIFEFKGVAKFTMVKDLVELFEQLIGGQLKWGILRDRDHAPPLMYQHLIKIASEKSFPTFHIWGRYSLENYLLEPPLLQQCIEQRAKNIGKQSPTAQQVETILSEVADSIKSEISGSFITQAQHDYRTHELGDNPAEKAATDVTAWLDSSMKNLDGKITALPGAKLFGKFVERLQAEHGINISLEDVIGVIDSQNAPQELVDVMNKIAAI